MKFPSTAVIIPLFNGARWIEKTLQSVADQTSPPSEVLVIDDGSQDGSDELVRQHPWVRLLSNPEKGANAARCFGLTKTAASWVALLDQDDLWHPVHLESLHSVARASPNVPAVVGGVIRFADRTEPRFEVEERAPCPLDPWEHFPTACIPTPSQVLIRREALDLAGGWSQKFTGLADFNAWLRLSAGNPFLSSPQVTTGYRQHRTSYSATLRADKQNFFVQRLFDAGDDALPQRLQYRVEQGSLLQGRSRLARSMWSLLQETTESSLVSNDALALAIEAELTGQTSEFVGKLWGQLFYLLSESGNGGSAKKASVLFRAWRRAPRKATRLRRSLRALALRRVRENFGGRLLPR